MEFKYINFQENLENYVIDNKDIIYVFPNNSYKKKLKNKLNLDIFTDNSLYLTLAELKEKLFTTEKFVLKEEKRTLLFYEAISQKMKDEQNIKGYYDVIDYGENFISFYKELREYKIEELKGIEPWQQERYNDLEIIKLRYEKLLNKYNYTTPDRIFKIENFHTEVFERYQKIVFVNIINFTPFEREFIEKLSNNFSIEFLLQMSKGDFDEESLSFKELTLPEEPLDLNKVEIIELSEANLQILEFIEKLSEDIELYSCDFENLSYNKLLNKELIKKDEDISLSETRVFKFITLIYEILDSNVEIIASKIYKTSTFLQAFESKDFRLYFKIDNRDYSYFMSYIIDTGIKYLDREFIEKGLEGEYREFYSKLYLIWEFLDEFSRKESIKDIVAFLSNPEKFNYIFFDEDRYEDLIPKYFEVLSELQSIEMMEFKPLWDGYFQDINTSLILLLLKYMRHKTCSETLKSKYLIADYTKLASADSNLIILDTNALSLPKRSKVSFLLTNNQRKENGLMYLERERELERYNFFRTIFTNKKLTIFSIKNEEKNIDSSPFVDELCLKYNIEILKSNYEGSRFSSLVRSLFGRDYSELNKIEEDSLIKTNSDLPSTLAIGSYTYELLKTCQYKYYLQEIMTLKKHKRQVDYKLDPRIIGLIIHEVFERLGNMKSKEVLNGDFFVSTEEIQRLFNITLLNNKYIIPKNYKNYYMNVMFPIFIKGIERFYQELYYRFGQSKLISFAQEKSKNLEIFKDKELSAVLRGRADLIIEEVTRKVIIDYKTGQGSPEQLDFYSILYYGQGNIAEKYIYNAWDMKWIEEKEGRSNILMKEDIQNLLKDFFDDTIYKRTNKKSKCRDCSYIDICRMRWEYE